MISLIALWLKFTGRLSPIKTKAEEVSFCHGEQKRDGFYFQDLESFRDESCRGGGRLKCADSVAAVVKLCVFS